MVRGAVWFVAGGLLAAGAAGLSVVSDSPRAADGSGAAVSTSGEITTGTAATVSAGIQAPTTTTAERERRQAVAARMAPAEGPRSPAQVARMAAIDAMAAADDFREDPSTTLTIFAKLNMAPSIAPYRPGVARPAGPGTTVSRFIPTAELAGGRIGRRPAGALTDVLVFASAGHGFTNDNTSSSLWYTQRPASNGVVEDFGNLDQMAMFARVAFRAGATVIPTRPIGHQPIERVIDNGSPDHAFFQGPWHDGASTAAFSLWQEPVPYRWAAASTTETAVARFVPELPRADIYPVYAWARDGADRCRQTYRVAHAGGVNEVRVDHRRVGRGWVFLGEYRFDKGGEGFVEVTNQTDDPGDAAAGRVMIADAVRFGNGQGDVNRGGGISGRPREEEASRYWAERAAQAGSAPFWEANPEKNDQDNNVGASPRYASMMNREREGAFTDRVYLSFHTNAVGGRGTVGLFNRSPEMRPDRQVEFAQTVARRVIDRMNSGRPPLDTYWGVQKSLTDSHINFGEIRRDNVFNEMPATLLEVAFHDNPVDAMLMRQFSVREAVARASLKAVADFLTSGTPRAGTFTHTPEAPVSLTARFDRATTSVEFAWAAPPATPDAEPPTGYRLYRSEDGRAFDGGVYVAATSGTLADLAASAGSATSATVLTFRHVETSATAPRYFRAAAVNRGGESEPGRVLGASAGTGTTSVPRALIVSAFTTRSHGLESTQTVTENLGMFPPVGGGSFARLLPGYGNPGDQAGVAGAALASAGHGFDSAAIEVFDIAGGVVASAMAGADTATSATPWLVLAGRQSPRDGMLTGGFPAAAETHGRAGGAIIVSGATVATALDRATTEAGDMADRRFARETLGVAMALERATTVGIGRVSATTGPLAGMVVELAEFPGETDYEPRPFDTLTTAGSAPGEVLLTYNAEGAPAAAVMSPATTGTGVRIALGFPVEAVLRPGDRVRLLDALLRAATGTVLPEADAGILETALAPRNPAVRRRTR